MRAIYLPMPATGRLEKLADSGPPVPIDHLYTLMDAIDAIATQTGRSLPWIALNWLLQRPLVSSVIHGARNEDRLADLVMVD
jgi:aryl-alcohol dehydrogenase-like predicted oxidoreductase